MAYDSCELGYAVMGSLKLSAKNLERRILGARTASGLEAAVHELEDEMLEVEELPDDFFKVFLLAFENQNVFSQDGAWHIVYALTTERHRLNLVHLRTVKRLILENFAKYPSQMLRHTVCDFVARSFQPYESYEILDALTISTTAKDTLPGFDILSKHPEWDEQVAGRAKVAVDKAVK